MDVGRRGTFVALGDPLRPQRGNGTFVGRLVARTRSSLATLRY